MSLALKECYDMANYHHQRNIQRNSFHALRLVTSEMKS